MPVGFIELATNKDRVEEFQRVAAFNRRCGVDVQEIGPQDVAALFPLCRVDDIHRGFYVPTDGRVNPVDATMALAKGARNRGARVMERVRVLDVIVTDGAATGVVTDQGTIEAEIVVNCAGQWAHAIGLMAGVTVPLHSAEHFYVVTEFIEGMQRMAPILRDPDGYTYMKEEVGGLVVGNHAAGARQRHTERARRLSAHADHRRHARAQRRSFG
jgi:4-methylaminobutanoate oxidase (formaldehyde-forming)